MNSKKGQPAFTPVASKVDYAAQEKEMLELWRERSLLRRTQTERLDGEDFTFFEGPPTANGPPGIHHVLARAFKDMFPRYRTMRGYRVLRKGGWDTHGLPVEIEVEKALGLGGKRAIEEYGIAAFNQLCRDSVSEYIGEWEALTDRMGFLVDMQDPYVTYENEYVESLWWIMKRLWDQDLLYQGFKSVPFCPRCGTPLSSHELSLGYKEDTVDPSVYVKFRLVDEEDTFFLAWTTTPWTLPGNAALAVGETVEYVKVRDASGHALILAAERAEAVLTPGYEILARYQGRDLLERKYEPLYTFLPARTPHAYVLSADFVTTSDGTGIVHIAPAFGADDLRMGQQYDLPILQTVLPDGTFRHEVEPWRGMFVKDADPGITQDLKSRGLLYRAETYSHTYPFCWRCDSPLLYYAKETWYIRTSACRERLVDLNQTIDWHPEHIRDGRFGRWLENNVDWALGRDRFWGTPLPIWRSDAPGSEYTECIGGLAELEEKSGRTLTDLDLHRPMVDEITWPAPDGGTMRRVTEVADCWFDSGAMPVAQWNYPFSNQEIWDRHQQADFICEAIDQTRGWFYTLHALSTLLFDRPAFKHVLCLGHILDQDGFKMSKSRGNVVNPWEVMERFGADATRWTMYSSAPPGNSRRFAFDLVEEVVRGFFNRLWNAYSFHVTYANLASWSPRSAPEPNVHPLDQWILSELEALIQGTTEAYETYDVLSCTRPIVRFADQLSNWYIRQNRRRFWDGDPAALQTLHEVLVTLCHLMAPAAPFVSEAMYQNLVVGQDPEAVDTVHLSAWPQSHAARLDADLNAAMDLVQRVARLGHAARQAAGLKVRQPLAEAIVQLSDPEQAGMLEAHRATIQQELNVQTVNLASRENLLEIEVFPLPRQLGQKYGAGYPLIRAALAQMDQNEVAARLERQGSLALTLDGTDYEVEAGDVEIRRTPRAGYSVADGPGLLVAIATEVTPALEREGQARDLVRNIQQQRKEMGLNISDRITLDFMDVSPWLRLLLEEHGEYLQNETLALTLNLDTPPAQAARDGVSLDVELGSNTVSLRIHKARSEPAGDNHGH